MERLAMQDLIKWKEFPYRKPLIVKGVRQVGKTWLLKEFGRKPVFRNLSNKENGLSPLFIRIKPFL